MRQVTVGSALILGMALSAGPASAVPILPAGSSWEYTFTLGPTGPPLNPDWNTETNATDGGDEADWSVGPAPFGNSTGGYPRDLAGDFDFATYWGADGSDGDDLWVRTTFDATGFIPGSIAWNLGADNGYTLYLNGTLISSANAEGYTSRWEYTGGFGVSLLPGTNVIAVALEDHGGLTAFDMEVVGDPVPEPGALLLLGSGLTALAMRRRRRS